MIYITHNDGINLKTRLTNLQTLCVSNNKLTHIPRELCQLPFLTELHLEGNLLEK